MGRWLHSTEEAFLLLTHCHRVRVLAFLKSYLDVSEIYQRCWLEESGQWLDNVNQTHRVLASWLKLKKYLNTKERPFVNNEVPELILGEGADVKIAQNF